MTSGFVRIFSDRQPVTPWFPVFGFQAMLGFEYPLTRAGRQQERDWQIDEKPGRLAFHFQYGIPTKAFFLILQPDTISSGMLRPSLDFRVGRAFHPYLLMEVGLRHSATQGYVLQPNHIGIGLRVVPFRKNGWAFMYEAGANFRLRSGYPYITTEGQFGGNFMRRIWPGVEASAGMNFYLGVNSFRSNETYVGLRFTPGEWLGEKRGSE